MQELKRFWRSLELIGGCATVPAQWRQIIGQEYALVERFFRPSGELATFFPHRDPDLLAYRVVTHGPDDHVGVCDETDERVALATTDLIIQELDRSLLHRSIAQALGICYADRPVDHLPGTNRIGHYVPLAGFQFPAFLAIPHRATVFGQVVDRLAAMQEKPFLLLAPTRKFVSVIAEELLQRRRACFLPLEEMTGIDPSGQLQATPAGERVIDAFRQDVVPQSKQQSGLAFFPTPPGASWSQVKIRLTDGHTASIAVGAVRGVYNYAQMGMANRKNGAPSRQWELLRAFAASNGTLTWRSRQADRRNQKRRELLARCLQAFFRIEGDPIVALEDGWQTRFAVTDQN